MRGWILPAVLLLPGIAGVLLGATFEAKVFPSSVFVFRLQMDTVTFAILLSSLWIILVLFALWLTGQWRSSIDRILARERLAQAEAHRRFFRRLNHELKNPLTAVRAGLANLDDSGVHEASALRQRSPQGGQASLHNVRQRRRDASDDRSRRYGTRHLRG